MPDIETVATKFKAWAAEKGILSYQPPEDIEEYHGEQLSDLTDAAEPAEATNILLQRKINLVLVDPEEGKIVVCTHRKITGRDLENLPKEAEGGFAIEYLKAAPPQIRIPTAGQTPVGTFQLHKSRYTCGSSISVGNCISAGTLGCLVRDGAGELYGLTNNHVSGGCGYSDPLLPIVAPGLVDVRASGHDPFTLGHHHSVTPWVSGSPDNVNVSDNLDAALFKIRDAGLISSMQRDCFDTPKDVMAPKVRIAVEKVGRTTGRTKGEVIGKSVGCEPVAISVPDFTGRIYFEDFYVVKGISGTHFADRGDSGALVCFRPTVGDPKAFGLVFAVSADRSVTFVVPLEKILNKMGAQLVSGHNT